VCQIKELLVNNIARSLNAVDPECGDIILLVSGSGRIIKTGRSARVSISADKAPVTPL
jgi:DNA helicase TIP49 (TBP-interacting protein)